MNKWAIGIIVLILVTAGGIYALYESNDYDFDDAEKSYEIIKKWELPSKLNEISGIYWIGDNQLACIQDEDGIMFIYDLDASKIIEEYQFGGAGDYESIYYSNNEFWVAESNGKLYNFKYPDSSYNPAEEITLEFEYRNNIEGLTAGPDNSLWLSVKDRNLNNEGGYKGVYSFNPANRELNREPVLKIDYEDPKFDRLKTHNPRKLIRPSDLAFSPLNDDLYVLDAEFQKIIIVGLDGKVKELHLLDPAEFAQPEGICFSPSGRMFISNESLGAPSNIIELKIIK